MNGVKTWGLPICSEANSKTKQEYGTKKRVKINNESAHGELSREYPAFCPMTAGIGCSTPPRPSRTSGLDDVCMCVCPPLL